MPAHVLASIANFDTLPNSAHVRPAVVSALDCIGSVTLWRRVRAGLLPRPIKVGGTTLFNVGDLRRLRAEQQAEAA
ncbi:MAG: transcriptional regulator [Burkholderiales bacterium]|nr:transcriptional regulator [Burkholderiales bacterium]